MASGRTSGGSKTPTKTSGTAAAKAAAKASASAASKSSSAAKPVKGGNLTPQQKVQAMRRKAARRQRRSRIILITAIVVVVAGAGTGIGLYYGLKKDPLANVQTFTGNTRNHVTTSVKYAQNPPTGGDHDPTWLNCGVYSSPVRNENAVHDLEHGAVWITYRPDLPQKQIDDLVNQVTGQTYETLSPYPGLPAPVVISSWDHQLKLTGPDDPGLSAFIKKYKLNPDTTPELGASCTGGTGTPIG